MPEPNWPYIAGYVGASLDRALWTRDAGGDLDAVCAVLEEVRAEYRTMTKEEADD